MQYFQSRKILTHSAVMAMLSAAIKTAEKLDIPQCIVIVDASGVELGKIRMTGSKFLSLKSALAKAKTAASLRAPGSNIPEGVRTAIGLASDGQISGLPGGLPIILDGETLGGIGVGSGSGDQDNAVAKAALEAIGAETDFN
jgi:uncharacterized protein GlcG (DUF336 family)